MGDQNLRRLMGGGTWYYVLGGIGIFLFSYFWVAMMFQPSQIAEDLKRNGGYIPACVPASRPRISSISP
jgi:preprotein translocase subunit SecY